MYSSKRNSLLNLKQSYIRVYDLYMVYKLVDENLTSAVRHDINKLCFEIFTFGGNITNRHSFRIMSHNNARLFVRFISHTILSSVLTFVIKIFFRISTTTKNHGVVWWCRDILLRGELREKRDRERERGLPHRICFFVSRRIGFRIIIALSSGRNGFTQSSAFSDHCSCT